MFPRAILVAGAADCAVPTVAKSIPHNRAAIALSTTSMRVGMSGLGVYRSRNIIGTSVIAALRAVIVTTTLQQQSATSIINRACETISSSDLYPWTRPKCQPVTANEFSLRTCTFSFNMRGLVPTQNPHRLNYDVFRHFETAVAHLQSIQSRIIDHSHCVGAQAQRSPCVR